MKIALVDHHYSSGGVSRFIVALAGQMAECSPATHFSIVARPETIARDHLQEVFREHENVDIIELPSDPRVRTIDEDRQVVLGRGAVRRRVVSLVKWNRRVFDIALRVHRFLQYRLLGRRRPWYEFGFTDETNRLLAGFDLVYLAYPFYLQPACLDVPVAATFHDLNPQHFPENYNPEVVRLVDRQTRFWLSNCAAVIASTEYIADDLRGTYPDDVSGVDVVYLAPYSYEGARPTAEQMREVRSRYGLPDRYAIYSGSLARYKNVIGLLHALDVLKREGTSLPLVITGIGTDALAADIDSVYGGSPEHEANTFIRASDLELGVDVHVLGYVSNADVDALTYGAALVVSPSKYEAGCGPAMDAWQAGVPVAFSNIPPFLEQISVLGVEAWVFDPDDPSDMARVLHAAFSSPEKAAEMAERSKVAITRRTWRDVAEEYLAVFERVMADRG